MGNKHNQHRKKKRRSSSDGQHHQKVQAETPLEVVCLEIVLKCASEGSREVIVSSVEGIKVPGVILRVVSSGVGEINKSDILMAETAGRLIIGYELDVNRSTEEEIKKGGVEVRLYKVIYRLLEDLQRIAGTFVRNDEAEKIIGRAKVIALFKSSRKGIILGCEVVEGRLARGDRFRIIAAMGQIYEGKIESLHIENDAVESAGKGSRVGMKIRNFNKAVVGDYVECIKRLPFRSVQWAPAPGVQEIV